MIYPEANRSLDEFLQSGQMRMEAHNAVDITPVPKIASLQDDVVFVSQYVVNRLGVRPGAILRMGKSKAWLMINSV